MIIIGIVAIVFIFFGILFLLVLQRQSRGFGVLTEKKIYQDTAEQPGNILTSNTLPLKGKPDYVIIKNGAIIPVEVKTGRTPRYPYDNHVMQVIAYCYLIEENYGKRPPGGYIRYSEAEFPIAYTDESKESLKNIIQEIMHYKEIGEEFHCQHPYHNIA